jgi:hypothetical protein
MGAGECAQAQVHDARLQLSAFQCRLPAVSGQGFKA